MVQSLMLKTDQKYNCHWLPLIHSKIKYTPIHHAWQSIMNYGVFFRFFTKWSINN